MTRVYLLTVLLSLLPISELRGAIPYAYLNEVPLWLAALVSIATNACVSVLAFLFLETINKLLLKWNVYKRFFDKTVDRARNKVGEKVSKYGLLGLMLFVAIPLPITGAWTGALGAWVMGLDRKKSILFITLGVLISGTIVSIVVLSGAGIGRIFTKTINI